MNHLPGNGVQSRGPLDGDAEDALLIDRLLAPFQRFVQTEAASGLVLLVCTLIALAWANSPWAASYEHLWKTEVTLGLGPLTARGTLHHLDQRRPHGRVLLPGRAGDQARDARRRAGIAATRRAARSPARWAAWSCPPCLYAALNAGGAGQPGWGVPMATDIAFALGVLALLGDRASRAGAQGLPRRARDRRRHRRGARDRPVLHGRIAWGSLAAGGFVLLAIGANLAGFAVRWAYALIGVALWVAVLLSGVHATIAGVLLAMTIPARTRIDEDEFLRRDVARLRALRSSTRKVPHRCEIRTTKPPSSTWSG